MIFLNYHHQNEFYKSRSSILFKMLIIIIFIQYSLSAQTAQYLINTDFTDGGCAANQNTCQKTTINGWKAYQYGISFDLQTFTLTKDTQIASGTGSNYWIDLIGKTPADVQSKMCLYQHMYLMKSGTLNLQVGYYSTTVQTLQIFLLLTVGLDQSQRIPNPVVGSDTFTISSTNTKALYTQDFIIPDISPYIWVLVCQGTKSSSSIKITNVHATMTCSNTQTKITLDDGSQACSPLTIVTKDDGCKTYKIQSTSTFPYYSCDSCTNNFFELKVLQASTKFNGCIQKASYAYDSQCAAYKYNTGFQCLRCTGNIAVIDYQIQGINRKKCPSNNFINFTNCAIKIAKQSTFVCVACKLNYIMDKIGECAPLVFNCAVYFNKQCVKCINGYNLIDNACIKQPVKCLKVDMTSKQCIECSFGYIVQNNLCIQNPKIIPCLLDQYRNGNGQCIKGNIIGCESYKQISGDCSKCIASFKLNPITRKCDKACPQPESNDQKYIIYNEKCILVDKSCILLNEDGYCSVCTQRFYAWKGRCYAYGSNLKEQQNNAIN